MDPSSRIGTTLRGKWRLDRLVGTGGFAAVYAATHRAGKRVAVKVLHPSLSGSEEVRRRFLKEAYAANAIAHPGVVGVSDDDVTEDGAAFLVMDLLEGESVDARRKRLGGRLGVTDVLSVAEQALDVLVAAHEMGIIHRDLKPENLFWTTAGSLRVLDFGIARFREPGDESTSTQTGLTMGSPAFMAPEQARGRWAEVDARTDVYAMGATMFTLLSGGLVHGSRNINEALISAATKLAPGLAQAAPDVPEVVAAVVDRALAFEKAARWPSARAMQLAVRDARAQLVTEDASTLPLGAAPALPSQYRLETHPARQDTVPFGAGTQVPGSEPPRTTEIAAEGVLPGSGPPAAAPMVTPSAVVATAAPRSRTGRAGLVAAGGIVLLLGVAGVALWLSARTPAEAPGAARERATVEPPVIVPVSAQGTSSTAVGAGGLPPPSGTESPTAAVAPTAPAASVSKPSRPAALASGVPSGPATAKTKTQTIDPLFDRPSVNPSKKAPNPGPSTPPSGGTKKP